jgi:hypothetical protein
MLSTRNEIGVLLFYLCNPFFLRYCSISPPLPQASRLWHYMLNARNEIQTRTGLKTTRVNDGLELTLTGRSL